MRIRRAPNGMLLHVPRDVGTARPMHVTTKVRADVKGLRANAVLNRLWGLVPGMELRGVRVLMVQVMENHLHLVVIPKSRAALHDATRYAFGLLARFLNKRNARRGTVFTDRFASRAARSAVEVWNLVNYVARNPADASMPVSRGRWDRGFGASVRHFAGDGFLQRVFGTCRQSIPGLLWRMRSERVAYASL